MTDNQIKDLIRDNDTSKLNLFVSNLLDKSRQIEKESNLLSIAMLILILAFYLLGLKIQGSIKIGPLSLSDISPLKVFIPLIFSFLILRYLIINSHKAEIKKIIRVFAKEYFSFDNSNLNIIYTDDFSRLLMPISIYDEINKINFKTKTGCIAAIFTFVPLISIILAPYVFVWISTYNQVILFKTLDLISKISTILTIWISLFSFFYLLKTMTIGVKESKDNKYTLR